MATVIGKTSAWLDSVLANLLISVTIEAGNLFSTTRGGAKTLVGPVGGGAGSSSASSISYAGSTNLSSNNVEAALDELDAEKASVSDVRFTDSRPPSGAAGGDLMGSYPNPTIKLGSVYSMHIADATIVDGDVAAANKDGSAATPSMRTLGTGAQQAAAGNDSRFVNARTPTGPAGGDLSGTYPDPIIPVGKITSSHIADGTIVHGDVAAANKDGAAATPSMRTLGTGASQALPGNARLSDLATPSNNLAMGNFKITGMSAGSNSTDAVNKGQLDSALSSLINGAPGALDQLNELAAALGNDPNFSTTILTALAGKANAFTINYGSALVPATWSGNITHNLNSNILDVSFIMVATNEPVIINWKRIDANNIQVQSDFAFAASALNILVVGK